MCGFGVHCAGDRRSSSGRLLSGCLPYSGIQGPILSSLVCAEVSYHGSHGSHGTKVETDTPPICGKA